MEFIVERHPITNGLAASAEERSVLARRKTEETISRMSAAGEAITFKAISEQAGVSRQYLYQHFKDTIDKLRTRQTAIAVEGEMVTARSAGRAATIELALRNKIARLEVELKDAAKEAAGAKRRLERALGEAEEWRSRHKAAVTELLDLRTRLRASG